MTLRMYALATRYQSPGEVDVEFGLHFDFCYWEERYDLHRWMERLYHRKGGILRECIRGHLVLTDSDLDRLEWHIRVNAAVHGVRGLFGQPVESNSAYDLGFIRRARGVLAMGLSVVYAATE